MVNMYYQISPRKRTLYIPGRKNRAMIIPVKHQPPTNARLRPFCVELDLGWACLADMFIGKDEEKLSPKCALRSAKRISDILSILYRIFAPSEENGNDIDLQGDNVKFVPLRWYKDNNGRDVTILSSLWFNSQVGVENIIIAPLGQEGIVFVDMAYTVTKRGLKLTLVMEMEVNKVKAVQDIMGSFLKISMLDDQMENDDIEETDNSDSPSETSAVLSQVLADIEKCNEDNHQVITQHLDELTDSFGDDAVEQHCQAPVNCQERTSDDIVDGEEAPTDITPEKSDPETSGEVQYIMQVLREQQQMRDDYERETAELKQRLMVLYHAVTMLNLEQQQFLEIETIGEKEEQDPRIPEGTKRESGEDRDDSLPACTPRQDTYGHNYNDQQMLEFQKHLQRRASKTTSKDRVYAPQQERASGVWKGKPPSPAEKKTPYVTTLTHYMKTRSTFTIHLRHCHICKKTIEALLHGARCLEDWCATCQQIAKEVAQHMLRCTRGTLCPLPICSSGVPLGLYCDGTVDETPMFVGLVRLYLRRTFHRG